MGEWSPGLGPLVLATSRVLNDITGSDENAPAVSSYHERSSSRDVQVQKAGPKGSHWLPKSRIEVNCMLHTLGAEGVLPGGHIESLLRVFKQFTHTLPSG